MKLEKELLDRVDSLGGKIDSFSQNSWESLVKYQIISGSVDIALSILVIVVTTILSIHLFKQCKKGKKGFVFDSYGLSDIGLFYVILVLFLALASIAVLTGLIPHSVIKITNPEAFAIKELVGKS